ncbi:MAG: hypothetical protein OXE73_09515 [Gammaproteobacteria bacterium]|nr:hypothetical protein [Gammaproteobacteria bacterium]
MPDLITTAHPPSDLVWKAMFEADLNRRYLMTISDRLRRNNNRLVLLAWTLALAGALTSLASSVVPVVASAGLVVAAASVITLRDVLRLPDRIADARLAVMGTNQEFDSMRLLWETQGEYRVPAECESFQKVSRFSEIPVETLDTSLRDKAEIEAQSFYEKLLSQERPPRRPPIHTPPSPTPDRSGGVPMKSPPPPPPKKG